MEGGNGTLGILTNGENFKRQKKFKDLGVGKHNAEKQFILNDNQMFKYEIPPAESNGMKFRVNSRAIKPSL